MISFFELNALVPLQAILGAYLSELTATVNSLQRNRPGNESLQDKVNEKQLLHGRHNRKDEAEVEEVRD